MILLAALALSSSTCRPPSSDAERIECARLELATAEQAMNYALARGLDTARSNDENASAAKGPQSRAARLAVAQDAWLRYREAQCAAEYLASGAGSLEAVNRIWCQTRLTKARTTELNLHFIVD